MLPPLTLHGRAAQSAAGVFPGGWIGYFAYEAGRFIEHLPATTRPDIGLPVARWALYDAAAIHDAETDTAKKLLFDAVNAGRVRVLMGSTEKMGAGTNVQRKLVALHHLDAPWRPRDIEQREGRILRQGNTNKEVQRSTLQVDGIENLPASGTTSKFAFDVVL